jgi:hypothetical protein
VCAPGSGIQDKNFQHGLVQHCVNAVRLQRWGCGAAPSEEEEEERGTTTTSKARTVARQQTRSWCRSCHLVESLQHFHHTVTCVSERVC